jgi:hypothetical protein
MPGYKIECIEDGDGTKKTVCTEVPNLDAKASPVDSDIIAISDTEDNNYPKKLTLANLKAALRVEHVMIFDGYRHLIAANQSGYYSINNGDATITAVENYAKVQMPKCSVKAIRGRCNTYGEDMTFTVRKNGANTTLTGSVTATGTFEITSGGPIAFADGDELSLAFSIPPGQATAISGLAIIYETELI